MERHKKLLVLIIALIALLAVSCDMAGIHTGLKNKDLLGTWNSKEIELTGNNEVYDYGILTTLEFTENRELVVTKTEYIKKQDSSEWTEKEPKKFTKVEYDLIDNSLELYIYEYSTTNQIAKVEYSIKGNELTIHNPKDDKDTVFVKSN